VRRSSCIVGIGVGVGGVVESRRAGVRGGGEILSEGVRRVSRELSGVEGFRHERKRE